MKIVIVGAGDVGTYLSGVLSKNGHDVTVVERRPLQCRSVDEDYNVRVVEGNGSSAEVLLQAEVDRADFFLPMTSDDLTNLVASSLAHALGAKTVITRIHDQVYVDQERVNYQELFGVDQMINPEALSALELAKSIRNPARVAVENFARGQIEAQRVEVSAKAKFRGKALRDLKLDPQIRFGFLQRGEVQDVPTAETVLEEGDIVTMFGPPPELAKLRTKLDPDEGSASRKIVILGGGETGIALVRLLSTARFRVRVVEKNAQRCKELAPKFPEVTFINGDGTSLRLLEEEQIGDADFFVAATGSDEQNIMTALQVHQLGAKHVQVVLNKSDYEEIMENLREGMGLGKIVAPRLVTAQEVLRYISQDPYLELFRFPNQDARIVEVIIPPSSPLTGKTLREIRWPAGVVIVALMHDFRVKVPGPDDVLEGGDRIVVTTREERLEEVLKRVRAG